MIRPVSADSLDEEGSGLQIVIPSRDGFPYTFIIAREYARLGLRPSYHIDSRSAQSYRVAARMLLPNATVLACDDAHGFVEFLLPRLFAEVDRRWIFRFDDDEFPSEALVRWMSATLPATDKRGVAIPRRAVRFLGEEAVYAGAIRHIEKADYQLRGFVRAGVRFRPELHTAGVHMDRDEILYAPDDCCIYHCDWLVHDRSQRAEKLAGYERFREGCWETFKFQYLPEDFAVEDYDYRPVLDRTVVTVMRRLAAAKRLQKLFRSRSEDPGSRSRAGRDD